MSNKTTPFIFTTQHGWTLALVDGAKMDYGVQYDEGAGYRVYLQYVDSTEKNVFPPAVARLIARKYRRDTSKMVKGICDILNRMADGCSSLEKIKADKVEAGHG